MITKSRTVRFTDGNGETHDSIEAAKNAELTILIGNDNTLDAATAIAAIVAKPREAIAILRVGLPRKPRTVKVSKKKPTKAELANKPD